MAEPTVKCGKCGTTNNNIQGKCSECGEYLYQYYLQDIKKNKTRRVVRYGTLVLVVLLILSISLLAKWRSDPVKEDLKSYLQQLQNADQLASKTDAVINYTRVILGGANDDDKTIILNKLGLNEVPKYNAPESDKYWDYYSKYMDNVKNKHSFKDRARISGLNYETYYNYYSKITPITPQLMEIHELLISSYKNLTDASESFYNGIDLGYISNVREDKDGSLRWNYRRDISEYSDKYVALNKRALSEEDEFKRKLSQLCEQKGLVEDFKKIYAFEGYVKDLLRK